VRYGLALACFNLGVIVVAVRYLPVMQHTTALIVFPISAMTFYAVCDALRISRDGFQETGPWETHWRSWVLGWRLEPDLGLG
jgi:hypothetical protein